MKKRIIETVLLSSVLFSLSGCTIKQDITGASGSTESSVVIKETETSSEKNVLDGSQTDESSTLSKKEKVQSMLDSLNQGMSEMFYITFDESRNKFVLEAKQDGQMDRLLSELVNNPSGDSKQQLEELSSSLTGFSESVSSSLGNDYSIELVNNYDDQGSFFVIKNGEISFPYLENK